MAVLNTILVLSGLAGLVFALRLMCLLSVEDKEQHTSWRVTLLLTVGVMVGYGALITSVWLQASDSFYLVTSLTLLLAGGLIALIAQLSRKRATITARLTAALEEQSSHIAYRNNHDRLTELANRRSMARHLDQCLSKESCQNLALFTVNLNGFKYINDTFGYDNGDAVLRVLANRIKGLLEDGDMAARNGADEFMIAVSQCSEQRAANFAQSLARTLGHRVHLYDTMDVPISLAIGIALFPEHADTRESLIRRCDIALQAAKQQHSRFQFYQVGEEEAHLARIGLMTELRQAVKEHKLILHYQPKQCLHSGKIVGVEALLRWPHPIHGMVPPDDFIPLAEQTGVIESISRWVISHALAQWQAWSTQGLTLDLSINISARDLRSVEFSGVLLQQLNHYRVPANQLILEITESAFMEDRSQAVEQLARLQNAGVRVAIDDFGTGYSSLSQLKDLPVNELKIDKSFIMTLCAEPDNGRIVRSIIELGRNLGLSVTAEGVEDEATRQLLIADGCDVIQGFGLSKPLSADELLAWLIHQDDQESALVSGYSNTEFEPVAAQYQPYPSSSRN